MLADNTPLNPIGIYVAPIFKFASILEKLAHRNMIPGEKVNSGNGINSNISVLLADDDIDDREFFEDIVREIDPHITVNTVADGVELMNRLTKENSILPDLLFLDLNMPGKNGKQCLREIRSAEGLKQLPVIIYSTSSLAQDITDTYSIGANLYFRKPNSFSGALTTLRKILAMDFENIGTQPEIGSYTLFPDKV